ncbi:MAG: hypothetical protein LQ342_007397 [Letrouitia transgressa]|nr:MAG: hypothetical protein LQ342_007397 [Letrouitia transgressa]
MCWNRGGQDDYNAWADLGNPGWDWEGMLPYFIKSETYTPIYSADIAREYSINYNPAVHGRTGPVQVSYPKYFYPQSTLNYLGVPTEFDPNDGSSAGAAFVPTDLDPNNQTRSDARRTYFDPYIHRDNFHVITGQHVTRLLIDGIGTNFVVSNPTPGGNEYGNGMNGETGNSGFGFGPQGSTPALDNTTTARFVRRQDPASSNLRITGVEFAANASDARRTINATREIIVAAGALHSAQLLQLSGIGPADLLESYDIPLALNLPGVGNNLQDHCLVGTFYPYNNDSYPSPSELTTNATYNAEAEAEYYARKTGPWTAGSPNALAFNPLPLISKRSDSILSAANGQQPTDYLIETLDSTLVAGFALQKQSLVRRLADTSIASYEIINNNAGSLTVSVMHPFSRGQCYIRSADPFEPPNIDPRWLSNPVDRQVLIEALLFNRQILATPAMIPLRAAQFVPPFDADEDAINSVINNGIRTEFHPSGTCAMLPLEQGGVVDPRLRVWGTQNLRVVDAGIMPMIPAAHLQAVVYAVAEKAADIVKADNRGPPPYRPSPSFAVTSQGTSTTSSTLLSSSALAPSSILTPNASSRTSSSSGITTTGSSSTTSYLKSTVSSITSSYSPLALLSSQLYSVSQELSPNSLTTPSSFSGFFSAVSPSSSIASTRLGTYSSFSQPSSSRPASSSGVSVSSSTAPSDVTTTAILSVVVSRSSRDRSEYDTTTSISYLNPSIGVIPSLQQPPTESIIASNTLSGVHTTSYSLPTTYSSPGSYPLLSSYPLPTSISYDLPSSYSIPSTISYELPETYSLPPTIPYSLMSYDLPPAQPEPRKLSTRSTSQSVAPPVVISVPPNSLLQVLSSIIAPAGTFTAPDRTLGVQVTITPAPSVLNPAELSDLEDHALTSSGVVPSKAATMLIPVVTGSAATPIMVSTNLPSKAAAAATTSATKQKQLDQAQISALIQWLLHLFHLA